VHEVIKNFEHEVAIVLRVSIDQAQSSEGRTERWRKKIKE